MAAAQNIIRTLTIRSTVEGADKTKADLKGIQSAHEGVARVTDTSAKNQLSLADAVAKSERRFNASIRAQQDFEKVQRQMNLAVAQNPALQARANAVLALAATHFDQVSKGQRAFALATQAANDNLRGFAQSAGPVGSILSTFGTGGIVAAAGIGAAVIALHQMVTASITLAERAGKLKDFAETTGFTVIELQALEKAGAQVGVSSESVTKALERFSVQMAEVKLATGETYEKLLAVNPVLAQQVREATSLSKAYELVSKAIKEAGLEQGNQLARAFFGRGGIEQTRLMRAVADAGGLKGVIAELHEADVITAKQAERWDTLGDKIAENMKAAKQNIASIFTEQVLRGMETFSKGFLDFTREVKEWKPSDEFKQFMAFFMDPKVQGALSGAFLGGRVGGLPGAVVGGVVGAVVGGAAGMKEESEAIRAARMELGSLNVERDEAIAKTVYYFEISKKADNARSTLDEQDALRYMARAEKLQEKIAIQQAIIDGAQKVIVNKPSTVSEIVGADGADRAAAAAQAAAKAQEDMRQATIASYNEMARWMSVIGGASTLAQRYELTTRKLAAAKAEGKINEEQYTRAIEDQRERLELSLGVANMAAVTEERLKQVRDVAAKAGLSDEQTRLAVQIALVEAKDRERAAWRRANPEMALAVDYAESLAKSLVAVAMGAGTISDAFKSLSGTLASDAIRSLFKGDLLAAGLQAAGAAVMAGLGAITDDSKQKELDKAKLAFSKMSDEVRNFNAAADGFELSAFVSAMQQIVKTGHELVKAAMAAGDTAAAVQLIFSGVKQINNTVDQFIKPKGDSAGEQIAAVQNEAQQIIGELADLNAKYNLGLNRTVDITAAAVAKVADIQAKVAHDLNAEINDATGKGFINDIGDLVTKLNQFKTEQAATGVDTSLIDRWFTVQAQKVVDGAELTGNAFNELVTMFPDLTGRVREYTAAVDDNAEALKRAANDTAKNTVDYLAGLQSGPNATVSPLANLTNSQSLYNANLALAQGGNIDAQNKFVSLADNLEKAARAVYASGQEYQDIRSQIIAQGLALPAVQATTDPVVTAIRDSITAIEATTAASITAIQATTAAANNTAAWTQGVYAQTNAVYTQAGGIISGVAADTVVSQRIDSSATRIVNAINNHGAMSQSAFINFSEHLAHIRGYTGWAATHNAGSGIVVGGAAVQGTVGGWPGYTAAEFGATIPPHGLGVFGEHHRDGPFFVRAGDSPIPITPAMPSFRGGGANDNGALLARIDRLTEEVAALRKENGINTMNAARHVGEKVEETTGAVKEQTNARNSQQRQSDRQLKVANR